MDGLDEAELETLRRQYDLVTQAIHSWARIIDASLALGLLVLGGVAAYGLEPSRGYVVGAGPIVLGVVFLYALQARAAIEADAGKKVLIERRINAILSGRKVLFSEDASAVVVKDNVPQRMFLASLAILYVSFSAFAAIWVGHLYSLTWAAIEIAAVAVVFAGMSYSYHAGQSIRADVINRWQTAVPDGVPFP